MTLRIFEEANEHEAVIALHGWLSAAEVDELAKVVARKGPCLRIDLAQLGGVDSAGLQALKRLRASGARFTGRRHTSSCCWSGRRRTAASDDTRQWRREMRLGSRNWSAGVRGVAGFERGTSRSGSGPGAEPADRGDGRPVALQSGALPVNHGIEGDASVGPLTVPVEASFSDLLEDFDFGLAARFEGRKNRVGFGLDFTYNNLGTPVASSAPIVGQLGLKADVRQLFSEGFAVYRSPAAAARTTRHTSTCWSVRATRAPASRLTAESAAGVAYDGEFAELSWLDAMAGVKGRAPLGSRMVLLARGDIAGFGSQLTWNLEGDLAFLASQHFTIGAGWRYMDIDYDLVSGNERKLRMLELSVHHVQVGAAHATRRDSDRDLSRSGPGGRQIAKLQGASRGFQHHRPHGRGTDIAPRPISAGNGIAQPFDGRSTGPEITHGAVSLARAGDAHGLATSGGEPFICLDLTAYADPLFEPYNRCAFSANQKAGVRESPRASRRWRLRVAHVA